MSSTSAFIQDLRNRGVSLVAVSKTKPPDQIRKIYDQGQRIFGENRVQELTGKAALLPQDIEWHMIGHLQRNKVKYVVPIVSMIQSVDNIRLIKEIQKEASKCHRTIDILLQIKIASEETKFGFDFEDLDAWMASNEWKSLVHINIRGLMGMASFVTDDEQVRKEFKYLKDKYDYLLSTYFPEKIDFDVISMGMSGDYKIALDEGSNMVRIGSLLFGPRNH